MGHEPDLFDYVIAWGILSGSFKRFRGTFDYPYKQGCMLFSKYELSLVLLFHSLIFCTKYAASYFLSNEINPERLKAIPCAALCINCQERFERNRCTSIFLASDVNQVTCATSLKELQQPLYIVVMRLKTKQLKIVGSGNSAKT